MGELNALAKRIHNRSPDPVRLTLGDGSSDVYRFSATEFFGTDFQAEGHRDGDDADYRLVTTEDGGAVLVGRRGDDDRWRTVGAVTAAEPA
jgi:hypothetical protein